MTKVTSQALVSLLLRLHAVVNSTIAILRGRRMSSSVSVVVLRIEHTRRRISRHDASYCRRCIWLFLKNVWTHIHALYYAGSLYSSQNTERKQWAKNENTIKAVSGLPKKYGVTLRIQFDYYNLLYSIQRIEYKVQTETPTKLFSLDWLDNLLTTFSLFKLTVQLAPLTSSLCNVLQFAHASK